MGLAGGDRVGSFEIIGPLGAGGMGEVYRARDAKLIREVAIKVLPPALALDGDYLARFTREAQALAALQHPNIATIYGLEGNAIVMELVEGAPLAGPLPVAEVVAIGRQIAEALEAAHEKGIVHRDLKPGNILITAAGVVKVLDFGLAKAVDRAQPTGADSPTLTMRATEAGLILGTAGYMAPEQAAGKTVDRRADIWSFGVILWELVTGKRLFAGETVSHTLADVLKEPIDFEAVPAGLRGLVRRCLDRNLKTRLQHIGEARIALENYAEPVAAAPAVKRMNWLLVAAVALLAAGGGWLLAGRGGKPMPLRAVAEIRLPAANSIAYGAAISPDGLLIAAASREGLSLRRLDSQERQLLAGTRGAFMPAWSPDSRALAYVMNRTTVQKITVDGGVAQILTSDAAAAWLSWGEDGTILYSGPRGELWKVPAAGGTSSQVTSSGAGGGASHILPWFLPGGKQFLFRVQSSDPAADGIYAGSLDGPASQTGKRVLENRFLPIPTKDSDGRDHLLYRKGLALVAQPFDVQALALQGEPIQVAPAVTVSGPRIAASASKDGVLLYKAEDDQRADQSVHVWLDRTGRKLGEAGPAGVWADSALAPDGTRLAATMSVPANNEMNMWLLDARPGSEPVRFTFEPTRFLRWPVWAPDGKRLLYSSNMGTQGGGAYERLGDGTAVQKALPGLAGFPTDVSPDGRMVLSHREGDLWLYQDGKATQLTKTPFIEEWARFSPDGRWIVYVSNETSRNEIWVQEFPLNGVRFQISTEGGRWPKWRRDGKELFYQTLEFKVMAVPVTTAPRFVAGTRQELFQHSEIGFDPAPDGQRFLVRMPLGGARPETELHVLKTHWSVGEKR